MCPGCNGTILTPNGPVPDGRVVANMTAYAVQMAAQAMAQARNSAVLRRTVESKEQDVLKTINANNLQQRALAKRNAKVLARLNAKLRRVHRKTSLRLSKLQAKARVVTKRALDLQQTLIRLKKDHSDWAHSERKTKDRRKMARAHRVQERNGKRTRRAQRKARAFARRSNELKRKSDRKQRQLQSKMAADKAAAEEEKKRLQLEQKLKADQDRQAAEAKKKSDDAARAAAAQAAAAAAARVATAEAGKQVDVLKDAIRAATVAARKAELEQQTKQKQADLKAEAEARAAERQAVLQREKEAAERRHRNEQKKQFDALVTKLRAAITSANALRAQVQGLNSENSGYAAELTKLKNATARAKRLYLAAKAKADATDTTATQSLENEMKQLGSQEDAVDKVLDKAIEVPAE